MEPSRLLNDSAIVANGLTEACKHLGITQDQIATAIGVSRTTITRIKKRAHDNLDDAAFASNGKPFELALLVIRVYRSLYAILGGNQAAMKHWMNTDNQHLANERPVDLIQSTLGIGRVIGYLDAMRGKI
ncbi:antitoxin Xre/MbcA/ParS toxin-binding domain-containing protein [Teredinibacter purpureus]|uniref:antitoxin Xre/MbcA/ParS toxin-binding domain-containing protein n=1 Tax=Teredinibacter purpureus TaxID=2731756 RepID=UPI0005F80257|nr:antitoxin Xre/MbcA/ParS toxin-binding domain-containing protein [Teredinibacter purpureus]